MESYLLAQERSWYDFMLDCMTAGGKMKRLDLAINDRAGILDIPKLKEKYKAGECISYFRMQKDYSGTEKCGSDTPKNTGETLYLGSTSSESFKRERWVKLRCLYNSRGRCFIPCYYTFFSMFSPILLGT